MLTIYEASLESIEVAKANAPLPGMGDDEYWANLKAFTEGTLGVMKDETAQWGQLIRTPDQVTQFLLGKTHPAQHADHKNIHLSRRR